jgi:hypothetical protein
MATRRPRSFDIRTGNDRVAILYPESSSALSDIKHFSPPDLVDEPTFNAVNAETERGDINTFTPEMAARQEGRVDVNGVPLRSDEEAPYNPASALGPEYPELDEKIRPDGGNPPPSLGPAVNEYLRQLADGFPAKPRPDLRIRID